MNEWHLEDTDLEQWGYYFNLVLFSCEPKK